MQQQAQSPFLPGTRSWWQEVSWPARVALVCAVPVALGAVGLEAVLGGSLGAEHPLSVVRLSLRLVPFIAIALCFAIIGTAGFRAWRVGSRLRKGLCPGCGYDLRAAAGRCPECGMPSAGGPGA